MPALIKGLCDETWKQPRKLNIICGPGVTVQSASTRAIKTARISVIENVCTAGDDTGVVDLSVPDRTSPRGLEQFIAGRTLLSGDSLAWSDLFVQIFSRHQNQEPFLVPAVAEPLVVWVMSGRRSSRSEISMGNGRPPM